MKKILLASRSPRRIQLLAGAGYTFDVYDPHIDEKSITAPVPSMLTEALARAKAEYAAENNGSYEVIIAADTLVELNGKPLGKPSDKADAEKMLKELSGKTHYVHTGCAVVCPENRRTVSFTESTEVHFRELSEEEIRAYVETGEPMDKAGAYGIQERGAMFVTGITGDFFNVMGLPLCRLGTVLRNDFGISSF